MGIVLGHPLGQVLKLEPMGKDQIVPLGGVSTERFVLFRRRSGFDVADMDFE
jgi:hypothetical protein